MATVTIIRPGMLTTVQDLGRWGFQDRGVPVAGPMDAYSHRRANRLAGNPDDDAALEVTIVGPDFETDGEIICAVAGAEFELTVNGAGAPMDQAFAVPAGGRVHFGPRRSGARATLAVHGGFDLPLIFGSRATSLVSPIGPFGGRPLARGDRLPVGQRPLPSAGSAGPNLRHAREDLRAAMRTVDGHRSGSGVPIGGGARVRVLLGPHDAMFTPAAVQTLFTARYAITAQSNRMGYRLDGPPLGHAAAAEILSDATPIGSLQVPASGQPILLMADRQTTGGYPKIATVISADLPLAGQLAPGDWIEFTPCTADVALDALRTREAALARLTA